MSRKYTNPRAQEYLLEAKACELVIKDLRRTADKYKRAVHKEAEARQSEFVKVMQYTSEDEIQDDFGWDFLSEAQYERYLHFFREGKEALENPAPTPLVTALRILHRIIGDIEDERREWAFSALSPKEQAEELERQKKAAGEWKERIAQIKRGLAGAQPKENGHE